MRPFARLAGPLARATEPVLDVVFPPRCALCGEGLGTAESGLCPACWGGLAFPGQPACTRCFLPLPPGRALEGALAGDEAALCYACMGEAPGEAPHDGIAAATLYNPASRQLVLLLKHGGRLALAPLMGRMMAARLATVLPLVDAGWLVVPVPLHRWRLWRRGFNQSALLGREIARRMGASLAVDALRRRRATPSLGPLDAAARAKVLEGAIAAHPARTAQLRGARILLVDDVLTSGATTTACIAALRAAGAERVAIACFARVA